MRADRRDQQLCMELLGAGKIASVIDRVFPLSEAAAANVYLESRQQIGKIVLRPNRASLTTVHNGLISTRVEAMCLARFGAQASTAAAARQANAMIAATFRHMWKRLQKTR